MKKKLITPIIAAIVFMSACAQTPPVTEEPANVVEQPVDKVDPETKVSATEASDTEIEKRVKEVADAYDGLYTWEEDWDMAATATAAVAPAVNTIGATADAAAESIEEAAYGSFEPVAVAEKEAFLDAPYEEPDLYGDPEWNREGYNAITESGFVSVNTQPFSTFGADVDTATYSNLRRKIYEYAKENTPPADADYGYGERYEDFMDFYEKESYYSGMDDFRSAIRIEEMVNYFDYDYEEPENGDKFRVKAVLTPCPWNDDTLLFRVGVRTEAIKPEGGSNIVFLIDTSGSMFDNNKLPLAQKAFSILQESLKDEDRVSIVTYAGNEEVVAEGLRGSQHEEIQRAIDSLEAWGSTNGEGGINKAYEIAEKYFIKGGNNRVILATDGDLNVGVSSEAGLIDLIEEKKETGVMLSCLGFGEGNYMDDKMEALADHGNGNYAYIDCSAEARKVLEKELWSTLYTVAKDTKFQVEFNPAAVKGYRQIGYENRQMAAEDFADDTKDGGEVGSGQTVTVLYEIVPVDSDMEIREVTSKYQSVDQAKTEAGMEAGAADEFLTVNIRYKEPDEDESKLLEYPVTRDMLIEEMDYDTSWAAGVAQFGMLLRDSEFKGTSTYKGVYDRLKKDPKVMEDDFKAEFLHMIKTVGQNEGGKNE